MDRILARGQQFLLALSGVYIVFLALLTTPFFQRHAIFLAAIRWPLFVDFETPAKYGLSVHRSLNVYITTSDGVQLGAWIVLPPGQDTPGSSLSPPTPDDISTSLSTHPTVLLFHGNAASRALPLRIELCAAYAAHLHANVVALDYRGFGDSGGVPSEDGLRVDARAAFDWVVERGAKAEDVLLVGMSLGTAVAAGLGAQLSEEGVRPKGVVLLAPFTSIKELLNDYHMFGIFPILQPLQPFPLIRELITTHYLKTHFNTSSVISKITAPILLAHAHNDAQIPRTHSRALFGTLLDPLLPFVPSAPTRPSQLEGFDWPAHRGAIEMRNTRRAELVQTQNITSFGTVSRFIRKSGEGDEESEVVYVESMWGRHDRIGLQQTVIDILANTFFPSGSS